MSTSNPPHLIPQQSTTPKLRDNKVFVGVPDDGNLQT